MTRVCDKYVRKHSLLHVSQSNLRMRKPATLKGAERGAKTSAGQSQSTNRSQIATLNDGMADE